MYNLGVTFCNCFSFLATTVKTWALFKILDEGHNLNIFSHKALCKIASAAEGLLLNSSNTDNSFLNYCSRWMCILTTPRLQDSVDSVEPTQLYLLILVHLKLFACSVSEMTGPESRHQY